MIRKSKTVFMYFLVMTLFIATQSNIINAKTIEKGNPTGMYYGEGIILSDGTSINIGDNYIALFVNGTLVPDYQVIIKNDRALVPVRLISQELGVHVDWNEKTQVVSLRKDQEQISLSINKEKALVNDKEVILDYPAILYNNITYVPLRFIAENLNATVIYAPQLEPEYTYYYDTTMPVSSAHTIVRDYPNIIIDEKYNVDNLISKEEAMKTTQEVCMKGLENFKKSMRENLINSGESPDRFNDEFKQIEMEIGRMMYIGEVSRYYKFTIGAYDILFDKYNYNIFFEMYSSGIKVKKVDINDPTLFISIFIVG